MKEYIMTLSNNIDTMRIEYDEDIDCIIINDGKIWNNGNDYINMIIDDLLDGYNVIDIADGYKNSFKAFLVDTLDESDFDDNQYIRISKVLESVK